MTMHTDSDRYRQGLLLAEAGRHAEALELIREYLQANPENAEALNDVGAILHCLGRMDEAIDCLERARGLQPDSVQIVWNLCEAYLAGARPKEAVRLFKDMQRLGILNADILNRTANVFLQQNEKVNAVEMLLGSLDMSPEQSVLHPMLKVIRSKRPKVAFFCGADGTTFLNDIVRFISQRYETRVFEGKTEAELRELMQWCDIAWFEWCTNLAAAASEIGACCKRIVRLHRYEAYEKWPQQMNWNNVDVLVTVGNDATIHALRQKVPTIEHQTSIEVVPNGVDLTKFTRRERPRGKNLAFVANLRMVKNPAFVLQCMQKLHYIDPEYRLHLAGSFQDEVLEAYLRQMVDALDLAGCVSFDGWQSDVNAWLQDKDFIVSTSICEGHPVGILEGMACGLKPVIHNFLGARDIFPEEFIFNIAEQFCEQVLSPCYEPDRYRRFVEDRYSLAGQLRNVYAIFERLESQVGSPVTQPGMSIDSIGGKRVPAGHVGVM